MIAFIILTTFASVTALGVYSDDFARNFMFPLSAAAYSEEPHLCIDRLFPNSTIYRQVTVSCSWNATDNCSGYTAALHDHQAIAISFRGSSGMQQVIEEASKSLLVDWSSWVFGGQVSAYFHDAFIRVWNSGMSGDFHALRMRYPSYEIWVTGHSLGGSLASLASSYVVGSGFAKAKKTKLVTFGQPRTGDSFYSSSHNMQVEYSFRVTHWRDIVPHVPFSTNGGYLHHRQEAFYKRGMKPDEFTVCKGKIFDCLSHGIINVQHLNYKRVGATIFYASYHHHGFWFCSALRPAKPFTLLGSVNDTRATWEGKKALTWIEGNEELGCSNGLYFAGSIRDHTHYFGKHVSEYGISGCVQESVS